MVIYCTINVLKYGGGLMSNKKHFILKIIATIFLVLTVYLPNTNIIKIVALITYFIAMNLESIRKLWSKYKTPHNDNSQK
jgi:hypothetical protein